MTSNFNQADHHGGSDLYLTPPEIIKALGPFDLDPCYGHPRPWSTAHVMWALEDGQDGLAQDWYTDFNSGRAWTPASPPRVWLNQPYSEAKVWTRRMAEHGNGIMLVFARTETVMFQEYVFPVASALLFIRRRLKFYTACGEIARTGAGKIANAGAPSVLVAYDPPVGSPINALYLRSAANKIPGCYVPLRRSAG